MKTLDPVRTLGAPAILLLAACNGQLAVVDDLDMQGPISPPTARTRRIPATTPQSYRPSIHSNLPATATAPALRACCLPCAPETKCRCSTTTSCRSATTAAS